jgi:hypothetical protein
MRRPKTTPLLFALTALLAVLSLAGCRSEQAAGGDDSLAARFGIEPQALRLTAGGYMLDFRFRVLDPQKAATIFAAETKPYLIDQASGAHLSVPNMPKLGPVKSSGEKIVPGRIYFVMFANPGRIVKSGGEASLVLGDLRLDGVTVL